ncbi:MAG TPA: hypothetical protein VK920_06475 [Solirubrobacterales bacterium]|nr:hypothetical protein [Solirubrobacterales bacterium]
MVGSTIRSDGPKRGRAILTWIGGGGLIAAAFVVAMAVMPPAADAVLSGTNGRIVFVSGRDQPNDTTAKLFLRPTIGSVGAGTAVPVPTATGSGQHRHPTWSPDRTMIAYAEGPNNGADYDIFVLDLTDPAATPQNITNSNNVTDDRPAWSPDGRRIAFETENADPGANDPPNQLNIKSYNVETGNVTVHTSPNAGTYEHKPAWTPDSEFLYYVNGNPNGANMDIVRISAGGGNPQLQNILADPAVNEFQPSISPDGTKMCFTRGTGNGFNSTARVRVASANGVGQTELPGNAGVAGYNCTWSPNGQKIAYVQGTFTTGQLVMENSDPAGPIGLISLETTDARFDGNPDWAPDGRPQCEDRTIFATVNTPVTIPLRCEDTGPAYEQTEVRAFAETEPLNGTVSPGLADPPVVLPGSLTYTPNAGFTGNDAIKVRSFDLVSFGDRDGTVTINVQPPGQEPDDGLPPNEFTFGKVKKNKKKGTAKLTVNVAWAGDVELAKSKKLKGDEKRAAAEGSVKLKVRPKGKTKKRLAETGKAKVKTNVTFTPDGGDPNTKSKRVKLKRK